MQTRTTDAVTHPLNSAPSVFPHWRHVSDVAVVRLVIDFWRRVSLTSPSELQIQELVNANHRKDELVATVCHELRSPLASIRHAMRLLSSTAPAPSNEMHTLIMRQVGRMSGLVDDLLDVTRIATCKLQLQRERLDLRDIIHNAIQTVTPDIESRRHHLTLSQPEVPVWTVADPHRLEQIFVNLLGNAAKYTEPGGRIAVGVDICDSDACIRVRDSGIGIAPQLLPHVFDLFTQSEDAETHSKAGLGIGLAIVRHLVDLHGGSVTASSRGTGQGSEFMVRLPRQACPSQATFPASAPTQTHREPQLTEVIAA